MNKIKPNSTRAEDWTRFLAAVGRLIAIWPTLVAVWPIVHDVLHTGKNIVVEEARRWGLEIRPSKWEWLNWNPQVRTSRTDETVEAYHEHVADLEAELARLRLEIEKLTA